MAYGIFFYIRQNNHKNRNTSKLNVRTKLIFRLILIWNEMNNRKCNEKEKYCQNLQIDANNLKQLNLCLIFIYNFSLARVHKHSLPLVVCASPSVELNM